jgi:hypothetical protein
MAKIDLNALKKQAIDIFQSIKSFAFILFDHLKNGIDFVITKVDTKKSLSTVKKATLVNFISYSIIIFFGYQLFIKNSNIINNNLQEKYSSNQNTSKYASSPKRYTQLFSCSSAFEDLPIAKNLTNILIKHIQNGNSEAYAEIIRNSPSYFRPSELDAIGGIGCFSHGFSKPKLPEGKIEKHSEDNSGIYWIVENRGLAGGNYLAIKEHK